MTSPPGRHCGNRLFEWAMAIALFAIGVELVIWPGAIARSKLQFMLDVIGSGAFTAWYLFFGMVRINALYLNGRGLPWTAYARAVGAAAGAFAWFQMASSLILSQIAVGAPPSPSVPLLLVLAGLELFSTYRAADDARHR